MRPVQLVRIAAEAEGVRLRSQAQRLAMRIVMGLVALVFVICMLAFLHIMIWYWLRISFGWVQYATAALLAGGDLVIAAFLAFMAARSSPSRVEMEALEVRRRAWANAMSALTISAMILPVLRLLTNLTRRARTKAS
jgi:hypothetical protein